MDLGLRGKAGNSKVEVNAFGRVIRELARKEGQPGLDVPTSIDLDLDIFDIEIDLFLAEFADKFRIDNSKFTWYKYGYPKGSMGVEVIKTVFGYRYTWVKKVANRIYKPKFRVQNLQEAMKTGRLV